MIVASQFFALKDYLDAGGTIAPSPEPETMQTNLDAIAKQQATT